jgi:hypothetical protein
LERELLERLVKTVGVLCNQHVIDQICQASGLQLSSCVGYIEYTGHLLIGHLVYSGYLFVGHLDRVF